MARLLCSGAILSVLAVLVAAKPVQDTIPVEFRMPDVSPKAVDTYLCYPMKMGETPTYLTGFVPHANMSTAHHILLYGCKEPGDRQNVWNCGEMLAEEAGYEVGPVCKEGPKIVYAWAMDAPKLILPKDVGFKVGADTSIQWLVLQVHYKDVTKFLPPNNEKDRSGITMVTTSLPQPKRAGVYLLSTSGEIPPHSITYMETACSFDDSVVIHPFAFRVHAHVHGEVVSGYRVRNGQWSEIGRISPKKPEMFYNVTHPGADVHNGDILAARCTMDNEENRTVYIGSTHNDEMCNFYIMYWVAGNHLMKEDYCTSPGPPTWNWQEEENIQVENVPNDASVVPDTGKFLKATQQMLTNTVDAMKEVDNYNKEQFMDLLGDLWSEKMKNQAELEEDEARINPVDSDVDPELWDNMLMARDYHGWNNDADREERHLDDAFNKRYIAY